MDGRQYPPQVSRNRGCAAFRAAVFRGLAVILPPLLTVLILIWVVSTTKSYIIEPLMYAAQEGLVWATADIHGNLPQAKPGEEEVNANGYIYRRLPGGTFIPATCTTACSNRWAPSPCRPAQDIYRHYVELTMLRPLYAIPLLLAVFVLLLYLVGKFMTVDVGGYFMHLLEGGIRRLPLVRNVYSAAKQISDFIFADRQFEFTRIVAVEFPRKGTWQMGFVTGEVLAEVRAAIQEPMLTVLIPYSPLPITGCTISVRKSECIDLNITFDQACEYIVSCGVVVPSMKLDEMRAAAALPEAKS